jgi:predicted AAA+ superfamily ATPase
VLHNLPKHTFKNTKFLRTIYEDIVRKDVIGRKKIKKEEELRKVARFLVGNFSNEFTYSSLKEIINKIFV